MATLAEALNEPLHSLFAPSSSFTSLFNAAARISGSSQTAPDEASATAALISEACSRGHSSFVADYALEICADPNSSSTDVRHMPVMQGDVCQAWVVDTATSIVNELTGVMSGGNMIANPTLISKLLTKLAGVRTANTAIRSGGLPFEGVPEDQLLQCHQLLSALSWMSNQGTSCGHMPDLQRLRTATEARSNALQDAALEDHCTLTRVQQALPADSNGVAVYPFPSLMGCLTSVFLSDPYGTEVDASRTDARARLVLYYFWDSGSQCDWRGLAEALGVGKQKAQWWHALFLLEHALGVLQLAGSHPNSVGETAANNAALQLGMCQDIDIMLYASQLLISLGELIHAERIVQQCCHGNLQPQHHCLSIFERIVLTLLDLDDLHGALAQIRRFVGTGPWTDDVNGLLYFLGTWAQEDDDKRTRFLELPLSTKEEAHFEATFPDLHLQLLQQTAQANNFWRAQVERMKNNKRVETRMAMPTTTASTDGAMVTVPQSTQPAEFLFDTESLTARNAKMVAPPQPMAALFQLDSALNRKRQRHL